MNFTLLGSVQERHSSQLLSPHQSLVNLPARLVPGHWVPERDMVCDTDRDWNQRQLQAGRQSGVNASKWSLPTFIVSNIDFTHLLPPCLKDKTNQWDYRISPQALVSYCWAKGRGLSGRKYDSFTDKIINEKITALCTLQLLFPLLYLFSFLLCNQQQHQRLATRCGLQRSLQAGCLSSKAEHAAGTPGWLVRAPECTRFTLWSGNGSAVFGVRRELRRARTLQFTQDVLFLGPDNTPKTLMSCHFECNQKSIVYSGLQYPKMLIVCSSFRVFLVPPTLHVVQYPPLTHERIVPTVLTVCMFFFYCSNITSQSFYIHFYTEINVFHCNWRHHEINMESIWNHLNYTCK